MRGGRPTCCCLTKANSRTQAWNAPCASSTLVGSLVNALSYAAPRSCMRPAARAPQQQVMVLLPARWPVCGASAGWPCAPAGCTHVRAPAKQQAPTCWLEHEAQRAQHGFICRLRCQDFLGNLDCCAPGGGVVLVRGGGSAAGRLPREPTPPLCGAALLQPCRPEPPLAACRCAPIQQLSTTSASGCSGAFVGRRCRA